MPFKILIVNPNSTVAMTAALEPLISSLDLHHLEITYFTAPPPSPPSIDNHATSLISTEVCLPILSAQLNSYDAFLIACYSWHPLVQLLRTEISRRDLADQKFVTGIFEASVLHALSLVDSTYVHSESREPNRWGIVTTGKVWEESLTLGVEMFLGIKRGLGMGRFAGVVAMELNAADLHDSPKEEVNRRMKEAVRRLLCPTDGGGKVTAVCLGCAGMVGLEETVHEVGRELGYKEGGLRAVDGVKAGVLILEGLLKGRYNK
ncbi:Asp/Glu/hydantoin racemase [Tirmania nivea]|nr:Asp/Glu/hydantoin racemase [Tirmania nivea]